MRALYLHACPAAVVFSGRIALIGLPTVSQDWGRRTTATAVWQQATSQKTRTRKGNIISKRTTALRNFQSWINMSMEITFKISKIEGFFGIYCMSSSWVSTRVETYFDPGGNQRTTYATFKMSVSRVQLIYILS